MRLPRFPRPTATGTLLVLLLVMMSSSVLYTRESLLFCEKALYGEMKMLERETKMEKPVKFPEVCPDVRARVESLTDKWLQVILALLVQFHPPSPPQP